MSVLVTDRLTLTPKTTDDYAPLCALWTRDDFTRQIGLAPMNRETVWLRLLRDIGHWQVMGIGNWTIRRTHDGAWLGSVGIFDYRRDLTPPLGDLEVGWGLHPDFQGQGYGVEAVSAALRHGDEAFGLKRTTCMISHDNIASQTLARRVGFTDWCEGSLRGESLLLLERVRP